MWYEFSILILSQMWQFMWSFTCCWEGRRGSGRERMSYNLIYFQNVKDLLNYQRVFVMNKLDIKSLPSYHLCIDAHIHTFSVFFLFIYDWKWSDKFLIISPFMTSTYIHPFFNHSIRDIKPKRQVSSDC